MAKFGRRGGPRTMKGRNRGRLCRSMALIVVRRANSRMNNVTKKNDKKTKKVSSK